MKVRIMMTWFCNGIVDLCHACLVSYKHDPEMTRLDMKETYMSNIQNHVRLQHY